MHPPQNNHECLSRTAWQSRQKQPSESRYRNTDLLHKILNKLLLRITLNSPVEWIKQVHHTRSNDGLFHRAILRIRLRLLKVLPSISLIPRPFSPTLCLRGGYLDVCILERPLHQTRKLAMMAVIENRLACRQCVPGLDGGSHTYEILPIGRQAVGQSSASQRTIWRHQHPNILEP